MRMPFATSMNASFCGVVTMTAALKPTVYTHARALTFVCRPEVLCISRQPADTVSAA